MTKNTLLTWDVAPSNDNIIAHLLSHKRAPQTLFYVPHFFWGRTDAVRSFEKR